MHEADIVTPIDSHLQHTAKKKQTELVGGLLVIHFQAIDGYFSGKSFNVVIIIMELRPTDSELTNYRFW